MKPETHSGKITLTLTYSAGQTRGLHGLCSVFLNRTSLFQALRSKINKWNLIQLRSFSKKMDTVIQTMLQPAKWEKKHYHLHEVQAYKELIKVDMKETNKPSIKWFTDISRIFKRVNSNS